MMHPLKSLTNENGSAIVIALMLLSLLTVMGIWSTRKSNIETLIAGNEVARKMTFYITEGGVIEGGFRIEEEVPAKLRDRDASLGWLFDASVALDMTDPTNWDESTSEPSVTYPADDVDFCVLDKGITSGDSLLMTGASQVRTYAVYSFHDSRMGQSLQEAGYKRRF